MIKKKRQAKKLRPKLKINRVALGLLFGGLIIISLVKIYPYFKAPYIDETKLVTILPAEIQRVLGTKTGPSRPPAVSLRVPILMYHYVEYVEDKNDTIRQSLNINPYVFESQIETLKTAGYTFLTASDLDKLLSGKVKSPPKPILITFDDGYRDFYTDVYPLLQKYQVKATEYVIVNFLNRPNHLYLDQLKEMTKDGLVEIGAHTMDHTWLKGVDIKTAQYEIAESRKELQRLLNASVTSFAYPYGAFDLQTINLVKTAGLTNAMSSVPGIQATDDNRYFLYRLKPGYRTGEELLSYLAKDKFSP